MTSVTVTLDVNEDFDLPIGKAPGKWRFALLDHRSITEQTALSDGPVHTFANVPDGAWAVVYQRLALDGSTLGPEGSMPFTLPQASGAKVGVVGGAAALSFA
jgi:hypothetical protein